MKNTAQMAALSIVGIVFFGVVLYSCYWVAKTVSYQVFYEDMVQQTVKEMVRPEALR